MFLKPSVIQKPVAALLIPLYLQLALPVALWAQPDAPVPPSESAPASGAPAPVSAPDFVLTPAPHMTPNRKVPAGVVTSLVKDRYPAAPADADFLLVKLLPEAMVPLPGSADANENAALARAIEKYRTKADASDVGPLLAFLKEHKDSRWEASLRLNLGLILFSKARFTRSLGQFAQAWDLAKDDKTVHGRTVADRALAERLRLLAHFGRIDEVETLLKSSADGRAFAGKSASVVQGVRDAVTHDRAHPEDAFLCGPAALAILNKHIAGKASAATSVSRKAKAVAGGYSLTALHRLAKDAGLDLVMAKRDPGAELIAPAVIHWKNGHYSAVLRKNGDAYLPEDDSYGDAYAADSHAVDEEGSGYFLVPAGDLPAGWHKVSAEEGRRIVGGSTAHYYINPDRTDGKAPNTRCPQKADGMAIYYAQLQVCGLSIADTPLFYSPAYGPRMEFNLTYNQREASQDPTQNFGNVGPNWLNGWVSYIDEARIGGYIFTPTLHRGDGGSIVLGIATSSDPDLGPQAFGRESSYQTLLVKVDASTYVITLPGGATRTFGLKAGSSGAYRYFLTKESDVSGNSVTYSYDSSARLIAVTDAGGLVTTLAYANTSNPLLLTSVTDPYGRSCTLTYDTSGRLTGITDIIGITSSFTYSGASTFIDSLTTPYGTSRFAFTDTDKGTYQNRLLTMTDPQGAVERVAYRYSSNLANVDELVPTGMAISNTLLSQFNTLYWDKKAWIMSGGAESGATVYHWAMKENTSQPIVTSILRPGHSRVWFNYEGQTDQSAPGTTWNVTAVGSMVEGPDGSPVSQVSTYAYNDAGHLTQSTDPLGRTTRIRYLDNQVDPTGVDVKNASGGWDTIASLTYDTPSTLDLYFFGVRMGILQVALGVSYGDAPPSGYTIPSGTTVPPPPSKRPLSSTDASGLTTQYAYNTHGQPTTITGPDGTVTAITYGTGTSDGTLGRPVSITATSPGSIVRSITSAYDVMGRPTTVTDQEGYAVTTAYDNFDRVTQVSYPDSTTMQFGYKRLDRTSVKDRAGRISTTAYTSLRQPGVSIDALGRKTAYEWCRCGELQGLTDAMGRVTRWNRNAASQLVSRVMVDGATYTYAYQPLSGRLATITDPKGQVARFAYNVDGSTAAVNYDNAVVATPGVSFTYDAQYGYMTKMTDGTGDTLVTYGAVGSPGALAPATVDGPLAGDTDKWTFAYDTLARLGSVTLGTTGSGANAETYGYDTASRLTSQTNLLGVFNYAYAGATSRVTSVSHTGGMGVAFGYDTLANGFRPLSIAYTDASASPVTRHDYEYAADFSLSRWKTTLPGGAIRDLRSTHDKVGHLTETALVDGSGNPLATEAFVYDAADNRISAVMSGALQAAAADNRNRLTAISGSGLLPVSGVTDKPATVAVNGTSATVDASNNWSAAVAVTPGTNTINVTATDTSPNHNTTTKSWSVNVPAVTPRSFTYDLNGNLTDDGPRSYTWDAADRLASVTVKAVGATPAKTYAFTYDGASHRVAESVDGTLLRKWIWAPAAAEPAAELDAAGHMVKRFFAQGEQRSSDAGSTFTSYYYTRDHLGSVRDVFDSSGIAVARYAYSAYGIRTALDLSTNAPASSDSFGADFGYTGHLTHAGSGLILTLYRTYDPQTGRWLSHDPIWENGGINIYAYLVEGPLTSIDEFGLAGIEINKNIPPNSLFFTSPCKPEGFYGPPNANFQLEYDAAAAASIAGAWTVSGNFVDMGATINADIGQFGKFDYQRNFGGGIRANGRNVFYSQYTYASNFGVGVYMRGAGFTLDQMTDIGNRYAAAKSSNAGSSDLINAWKDGWNAANDKKIPKGVKPSTKTPNDCDCKK